MADVVEHFEVSGDWRHIIEDGMVDLDALPDEVRPTGHVEFTPVSPDVSVAGVPARAYTLGTDTGLIADGLLTDMQGRDGVHLAGRIGDVVVRWRAVVHLEYRGQVIPYPDVEFDLSGPVRLTGIIHNDMPGAPPFIVDPRIEAIAARLDEADQLVTTVAGYAQEAKDQVPLAEAEADRAIGLANAQDVPVAGVLSDPDSATHAAFKSIGNATYAPREGSAVYASKSEVASLIEVELDGSTVASVEPTPDALAKRTSTGSVRVPDPTGNLDSVNRQWALAEIAGSTGPLAGRVDFVEGTLYDASALEGMVLTITSGGPAWRFPADSYQSVYTITYP